MYFLGVLSVYVIFVESKRYEVFFELYDGETLVSRARWYERWIADLSLPCTKLSANVDETDRTITVTCHDSIALGMAFDGRFIAEDNFIDLLEGGNENDCFYAAR